MDWLSKVADAKALADKAKALVQDEARHAKDAAEKARLLGTERVRVAVEAHWPAVQRAFTEQLQQPAAAAISNDALMRRVLPLVYQALPVMVRVVVHEDEFVEFCLTHRTRLLPPEQP